MGLVNGISYDSDGGLTSDFKVANDKLKTRISNIYNIDNGSLINKMSHLRSDINGKPNNEYAKFGFNNVVGSNHNYKIKKATDELTELEQMYAFIKYLDINPIWMDSNGKPRYDAYNYVNTIEVVSKTSMHIMDLDDFRNILIKYELNSCKLSNITNTVFDVKLAKLVSDNYKLLDSKCLLNVYNIKYINSVNSEYGKSFGDIDAIKDIYKSNGYIYLNINDGLKLHNDNTYNKSTYLEHLEDFKCLPLIKGSCVRNKNYDIYNHIGVINNTSTLINASNIKPNDIYIAFPKNSKTVNSDKKRVIFFCLTTLGVIVLNSTEYK